MKYPISSAIGLFLGMSQVMAATLPLNQQQQRQQDLVPNFGPDGIHREYFADNRINWQQTSLTGSTDPEQVAMDFARSYLTNSQFVVHSSYTSDLSGVTHVHLRQKVKGLQVMNANINVNVLPNGQILSYGESFAKSQIKIQKSYTPPSFFQQVQNGLAQIILGGDNRSIKEKDDRFSTKTDVEEEYGFVNGDTMISPNAAVVALFDFVKPKLPDPSIASILTPDDLTPTQSFRPHDDDDDAGSTVHFEGVPFSLSPVRARRAYMQQNNGDLVLVWDVEMELEDNWYSGQVHAFDGTMVGLVDWVHEAADGPKSAYYNVIPFGANDPSDAEQQLIKNPYDPFASPEGWHSQGAYSKKDNFYKGGRQQELTFNVTVGNNVYAHTNPDGGYNWENNYRPQGQTGGDHGDALVFDYKANFDVDEPETYEDAAVTNLFYVCNMAHDFFHRYGFDEKAGNFQQDNLGRGRNSKKQSGDGEGDAVIANAQDGSGRNNANFATPPDGQHGKMRMYVWDQTHPMRDGDFETGIVIHEYTHGVSNRLTGGPKNSNCLGWGESGGMGEGWGDFVATIIRMKPEYKRDIDFGMGDWANGGDGIRKYKYSTSKTTNPSTYRIMDRFDYWGVHAKGEVWAEMLYEMYWNLVDKHGFTPEWFPPTPTDTINDRGVPIMSASDIQATKDHILSHGNTLALQLVLDGMKLQPCSPSFTDARDAILDADKALTGGDNYCDIYTAFAKRGLGVKAKLAKEGWIEQRKEDYDVPDKCK